MIEKQFNLIDMDLIRSMMDTIVGLKLQVKQLEDMLRDLRLKLLEVKNEKRNN